MILAISVISPIKVLMFIIVSITAVSATAVSNGYLRKQPLPYFSSSCGSALGNNWGLVSKSTSLANLIGSCGLTRSYRSNKVL